MTSYADLEISLHKRSDDVYTVEGRFTSPDNSAEISLGAKEPITLPLDLIQLQDCLPDMQAYGKLLGQALFVPEVNKLFLYAQAAAGAEPLRFRLMIGPTAPELHGLHWETLVHPLDGTLLAANQNILFSRYLSGENWTAVELTPRKQVRALVAISGPENLADYKLSTIDVERETELARASLRGIETTFLPSEGRRCSLVNLAERLREDYDILYLVAHGSLVNGIPYLWLEDEAGQVQRVTGKELAEQVRGVSIQPRLVILASCESAGKAAEDSNDSQALSALGPLLAGAGVPAVIAMQGKISMASVSRMMPVFFDELLEDGLVDRALAAARCVLLADEAHDIWMPVLFSRLQTGALWREKIEKQLDAVHETSRSSLKLQWFWFPLLFAAIIGVGLGLYFALRPRQPAVMSGDFRIAVASFVVDEEIQDAASLGYDLADSVRLRLEQDVDEINPGLVITIWGPDLAGAVSGQTAELRAASAEALAEKIHADLVIYGVVQPSGERWQVTPEFYIAAENFYEAREVVGPHDLGTPLDLPGTISNSAWRFEFGKQMLARGKALSALSVGLGYMALHEYEPALEHFESGLSVSNRDDLQGQKVLYMLAGNAAAKIGEKNVQSKSFEEAQAAFLHSQELLEKAVSIDPEYARPYITLSGLAYMRALMPALLSGQSDDVGLPELQTCFDLLQKAENAADKPPLADVDAKAHYSRGQCLLLQALAASPDSYALARTEYLAVIEAYADGQNPRLKEVTAESHARLGAIYLVEGEKLQAVEEYQIAINLLADYPERSQVYEERIQSLLLTLTPAP
jgi:tetratricopeptide (TPR) repeat protein